MQPYFYDPEYQAQYQTTQNTTSRYQSRSDRNKQLEESIFALLHHILTEDANNSYIQSFLTVNQYVEEQNLNPEEVMIELHETKCPPNGKHP